MTEYVAERFLVGRRLHLPDCIRGIVRVRKLVKGVCRKDRHEPMEMKRE
jgi:hypothetical protein